MNTDIIVHIGNKERPAVLFIHGLAIDKAIWINPSECTMFSGLLPLTALLSKKPLEQDFGYSRRRPGPVFPGVTTGIYPEALLTLFHDMRSSGYTVATWSQKRPVGEINTAVIELGEVINYVSDQHKNSIILVGHSRGGLIARKYLMQGDDRVKGLITISTPHQGSSIARLAVYLSPLAPLIAPLLTQVKSRGMLKKVLKRTHDLLASRAAVELLPDSDFFRSLQDKRLNNVRYMTIGGTSPALFSLYRWKWTASGRGDKKKWLLCPETIVSVPDIFEKIIPEKIYPLELKKNMGDGIVSAESSSIPWCDNHYLVPFNHAGILFDRKLRKMVREFIEEIG